MRELMRGKLPGYFARATEIFDFTISELHIQITAWAPLSFRAFCPKLMNRLGRVGVPGVRETRASRLEKVLINENMRAGNGD